MPDSDDSSNTKKQAPWENPNLLRIDLKAVEETSFTLRKLSELFRESTGLDAFFFFQDSSDHNWEQKPLSQTTHLPKFCQLLQSHPKGRENCLASHQTMALESAKSGRPLCQHCHAGLLTFHHPVYINGKGVGVIQTVCAISQKKKVQLNSLLHKKIKPAVIPEADVENAIHEMRIVSKQQLNYLFDWLELIVNYLAEISRKVSHGHAAAEHSIELPTIDYPEIEHQLRSDVSQSGPLPPWRAQRCTGCSSPIIDKVKDFLSHHYAHPLTSQVIAQALGFEPSYFAKMFKQHAKESFTTMLRRLRLSQATELLQNPHLSILEIAQQTGFSNPSFFTSVFRGAYGMTPSQYRSRQRATSSQ